MIDIDTAVSYLKQTIAIIEERESALHVQEIEIGRQKKSILLEKEALIAKESAFREQTGTMTREIERHKKMHDLAVKMKQQVDEQRAELEEEKKKIKVREEAIQHLEEEKSNLDKRIDAIARREKDVEEQADLALKDKLAARSKQEDLTLKEAAIKRKQEQLQKMIDAQKI